MLLVFVHISARAGVQLQLEYLRAGFQTRRDALRAIGDGL